MGRQEYRPEIDGLRAIAILSVVAYHSGVPGLSGGFAGVDVFFVISGFLITGLLVSELEQRGRIDLLEFFSRRARRLLPALFIVVAATLALGAFFLLPVDDEQTRLADSAASTLLYFSNFYFAQKAGYFDPPAEMAPLLHTWSLSVEEQFYIIWPGLLIALALLAKRLAVRWPSISLRRMTIVGLAVLASASFLYSWTAAHGSPAQASKAFYLITSRAWELGAGALLALVRPSPGGIPGWAGSLIGITGLGAILVAILALDRSVPYPGTAAALPVLGTVAVIASVLMAPRSLVGRLLTSPWLVAIGLVSYGWYLWHWPLLTIARIHAGGEQELLRNVAISLASLGLAGLTYVLVENPVRRRRALRDWSASAVLRAAAATGVSIIVVGEGFALWSERAARAEDSPYARLLSAAANPGPKCTATSFKPGVSDPCVRLADPGRPYVLLWGDSHARHLRPLLEAAAETEGFGIIQRTWPGCPPLLAATPRARGDASRCSRWNQNVFAELTRLKEAGLTSVVLSGRWTVYTERTRLSTIESDTDRTLESRTWPGATVLEILERSMQHMVSTLSSLGLRVLVVAPLPQQRFAAPSCLARRSIEQCSVERVLAEGYRSGATGALTRAISSTTRARLFDPLPSLCLGLSCLVERDGIILYRDDDHLTPAGARSLLPAFLPEVRWLSGPEGPSLETKPVNARPVASRTD